MISDNQAKVLKLMRDGAVVRRPVFWYWIGDKQINIKTFGGLIKKKMVQSRTDSVSVYIYTITDLGKTALAEWEAKHDRHID